MQFYYTFWSSLLHLLYFQPKIKQNFLQKKNPWKCLFIRVFQRFMIGANDGTWTRDLRLTKAVHYRLCYISIFSFWVKFCCFLSAKKCHFYFTKAVHYRLCYISIFSFWVKFCCFLSAKKCHFYFTKAVHYRLCYISIFSFWV